MRLCPGCPEPVIAERESHGRGFVARTALEGDPHALHDPDGEGVSSGWEHLDIPYARQVYVRLLVEEEDAHRSGGSQSVAAEVRRTGTQFVVPEIVVHERTQGAPGTPEW